MSQLTGELYSLMRNQTLDSEPDPKKKKALVQQIEANEPEYRKSQKEVGYSKEEWPGEKNKLETQIIQCRYLLENISKIPLGDDAPKTWSPKLLKLEDRLKLPITISFNWTSVIESIQLISDLCALNITIKEGIDKNKVGNEHPFIAFKLTNTSAIEAIKEVSDTTKLRLIKKDGKLYIE